MEFMLDREPSSDGQSRLPPATSGHAYPPVENSARPRHGRRAFAAGCRALGMGASGREPTQQTKPNQTPEADETYGRIGAFAIVEIVKQHASFDEDPGRHHATATDMYTLNRLR